MITTLRYLTIIGIACALEATALYLISVKYAKKTWSFFAMMAIIFANLIAMYIVAL